MVAMLIWSMTVPSLPRNRLGRRTPEISLILCAVRCHSPDGRKNAQTLCEWENAV